MCHDVVELLDWFLTCVLRLGMEPGRLEQLLLKYFPLDDA